MVIKDGHMTLYEEPGAKRLPVRKSADLPVHPPMQMPMQISAHMNVRMRMRSHMLTQMPTHLCTRQTTVLACLYTCLCTAARERAEEVRGGRGDICAMQQRNRPGQGTECARRCSGLHGYMCGRMGLGEGLCTFHRRVYAHVYTTHL